MLGQRLRRRPNNKTVLDGGLVAVGLRQHDHLWITIIHRSCQWHLIWIRLKQEYCSTILGWRKQIFESFYSLFFNMKTSTFITPIFLSFNYLYFTSHHSQFKIDKNGMSNWVQVVIPTGRYSDRSIFRQVVFPTGRYSDKQVVIPTGRYSDRSIFRQAVRYSDRSLFRQVDSPTNRSLFRQFDSSTKRLIFRKVYIPTGRYSDIKIIVMRGLTTINSYCGHE